MSDLHNISNTIFFQRWQANENNLAASFTKAWNMARAVVADSTNVQVQWSEVPVVESSLKWKFTHLSPLRHDKVVSRVGSVTDVGQ